MESNFNLGMDEDGIEELLEVVPEELTMEEVWELEQEHIAKEKARERETEEKKRRASKRVHKERISRSFFIDHNNSFKNFKTWTLLPQHQKVFVNRQECS